MMHAITAARLVFLSAAIFLCNHGSANAQRVRIGAESIDRLLFGSNSNEDDARAKANAKLAVEVDRINNNVQLTPVQKRKLLLAGKGDVQRIFDEIDVFREGIDGVQFLDRAEWLRISTEARYLNQRLERGLFDQKSLFQKVDRTLAGRQRVLRLEELKSERRRLSWQTNVNLFVAQLNREIPLTASQRQKLIEFILRKPVEVQGANRYWQISNSMSQRPVTPLAAFLDAEQMKALHKIFRRAKIEVANETTEPQ